jgi:hypothetical protein
LDPISAARTGVLTAVQSFDGAGADFANAFTRRGGGDNTATAAVGLINGRNGVRASLAAFKVATKTQRALLDITV